MLMSELIAMVKDIVRRPELDSKIEWETVRAVRTLHCIAEFEKDKLEVVLPHASITFSSNSLVGEVSYPYDMRTISDVSGTDSSGNIIVDFDKVTLGELRKLRQRNEDWNTYYLHGNKLSFKSKVAVDNLVVFGVAYFPGYAILSNTDGSSRDISAVEIANYSDWLLEFHGDAVLDYCVGSVCAKIGESELASFHLTRFDNVHRPVLLLNVDSN